MTLLVTDKLRVYLVLLFLENPGLYLRIIAILYIFLV